MNPFHKNRRGASVVKQSSLQDRRNMPRAVKEPSGEFNPEALSDNSDMQGAIERLKKQIYPPHTELDAYNQLGSKLGLRPLSQQEYDELQRTKRRPEYTSRPAGPGDPSITANPFSNESKIMNKKLIRLTESDLHQIVKESVQKILSEMKPNDVQHGRHKFKGLRYDKNGNPLYTHPSKLEDPDGGTLSDDDLKSQGWKYSKKHGLHGQISDPTRLPK